MKKAFTLIELLIVIAIIGILAGILFVSIGQTPLIKSRDSKRVADLQNLRTALTLYYTDNNVYPTTAEGLDKLRSNGAYIPAVPKDPLSPKATPNVVAGDCNFLPNNLATYDYRYTSATGATFLIQACIEDKNNPALKTDANNANGNIFDVSS